MASCCDLQYPLTVEICALKEALAQIAENTGHPPLTVTFGPAANSFDETTQVLHVQTYVIPATPAPEVVVVSDAAARSALAPTKLNSLLIQTTDAVNGNYSVWAASSLVAGGWDLKTATMAAQNSNAVSITGGSIGGIVDLAVADGGTGASTPVGARQNLAVATAAAVTSNIDWLASNRFSESISGAVSYTFTNVLDGLDIMVAVASSGAFAVDFPDDVEWPGGVQPVHSGAGSTCVYAFARIGGVTYGSAVLNFLPQSV